jgi:hypothetical protein
MDEYSHTQVQQLHQLFIGHPSIFDPESLPYDLKSIRPLLLQDPFIFLCEAAVCVAPALNLDIHHVLRLCYLAEMVRVAIAFTANGGEEEFEAKERLPTRTYYPLKMTRMPWPSSCFLLPYPVVTLRTTL